MVHQKGCEWLVHVKRFCEVATRTQLFTWAATVVVPYQRFASCLLLPLTVLVSSYKLNLLHRFPFGSSRLRFCCGPDLYIALIQRILYAPVAISRRLR